MKFARLQGAGLAPVAWAAVSLATLSAFAFAPPLGSGAVYRATADHPMCSVQPDLTIDVVPSASKSTAAGPQLSLAIDAQSRAPDALLSTFAYALYDDVGGLIRTGDLANVSVVPARGRVQQELRLPAKLAPGFYRLSVVGIGVDAKDRELGAAKNAYFEVLTDGEVVPMAAEEWRLQSRYDVPRVTHGP